MLRTKLDKLNLHEKKFRGKLNCQYIPSNSTVLYKLVQLAKMYIVGQLIINNFSLFFLLLLYLSYITLNFSML